MCEHPVTSAQKKAAAEYEQRLEREGNLPQVNADLGPGGGKQRKANDPKRLHKRRGSFSPKGVDQRMGGRVQS